MATKNLYLKQNTLIEPLFNQWYAWSYLIPPAPASVYTVNSHVKIMESFVSNPQLHVSALKNPKMVSGPFMHYDSTRAADIDALLKRTKREHPHLFELAAAIEKLGEILSEVKGYSLEPLYTDLPDALRGYVELVYDTDNKPMVRFIERLLYKSPYYDESSQSIGISAITRDERTFVFNTPRLESDSQLHIKIPFRHEALDELFEMRFMAKPYGFIKEALGLEDRDELFSTFFTEEPPAPRPRYSGEGVRIRYYGHACLLVESRDVSILCDPVISYKYDSPIERYTYADLPDSIDYLLLTHTHQDHLILEALLQLRHKVKNVVVPRSSGLGLLDPSLKLALQVIGFRSVREIDELEAIEIDGGAITGLPFLGEHADLNIRTKTAYQIDLQGRRIQCMADSNNIEPRLYDHIVESAGQADRLFIGMECDGAPLSWVYGPFIPKPLSRQMDQSRRLNGSDYERVIGIVDKLKPKGVYVYAMGLEPWLSFVMGLHYTETSRPIVESDKLISECNHRGIPSERLLNSCEMIL